MKQLALGYLFGRVDRFLYIGTANKRLYQSFGVPEVRLIPAPYAVDNVRFAKQAAALRSQRMELRRRWGIADGAFCVLFCGKFIAKKRPIDLIAAARCTAFGWTAAEHSPAVRGFRRIGSGAAAIMPCSL